MSNMNDVSSDALYVMLKGEPGTRKSTQALSFPLPQYWFSVDKKMRALKIPMKNWNIDPTQVEFDDYNDWMNIEKKLISLQERCRTSKNDKLKTIVFDSVTSIADVINIQTRTVKAAEGVEKNVVGGIRINTIEDYKAESSAFVSLIDKTKWLQTNYNVNIILIAHVVGERQEKEVGVTAHSRIIITGGKTISGKIPAYCEETYHFDVERSAFAGQENKIRILTQHAGVDFARTTLPLSAEVDITNKKLYDDVLVPAIAKLKGAA